MGNWKYKVKILKKEWLTHDVMRLELERPKNFEFTAGQAIELTIDEKKYRDDAAPFTLTGHSSESFLELILKVYPEHNGITLGLSMLNRGDTLLIGDAWDSFQFKEPGIFIAGGTGVTPFVAILRDLESNEGINNQILLFANKTEKDVFLSEEFREMEGLKFVSILSQENVVGHCFGRIGKAFLEKQISDYNQMFYLCGPGSFSVDIKKYLTEMGVEGGKIVSEY